ncbi:uncharacterized protein V6R79_000820 [Siganus canaliculatus]
MERKEEMKLGASSSSLPADLSCLALGGGGGGGGGGGAMVGGAMVGGAMVGEAALLMLEKQLICPICLELFSKPVVILPCQHNLCRKCANELYQPSLFQARTTMSVSSGRFRCPSCRHEVVLDRHGVYGLQRNLLVENIIDVYRQEVSGSSSDAAGPLPLQAPPPADQVSCSEHAGEKVNIYCLDHQVPTCSLCKVFGAHQSCRVSPLSDVYQQQKDELSNEVRSLEAANDRIQAVIEELDATCRQIEENCKAQKQSVCEAFSRVCSVLEEKQKVMTQRISAEQDEKTAGVQEVARCYGDSVEANIRLMEAAASSMEEQDMADFVQNSRELITKVITASSFSPSLRLDPGFESMDHFRFSFQRQERVLRSIDFLHSEEPEVEPEPEPQEPEPEENLEPKQEQKTSEQNLEPDVEPDKTPVPVDPVQTAPPAPARPGLTRDLVLQPETELDQELNPGGAGAGQETKDEMEEEEEEEEERCAAADPVKDGNHFDHEDGMSTQQAVTLLFYLLAFLVLLQRAWAYIGCFICT